MSFCFYSSSFTAKPLLTRHGGEYANVKFKAHWLMYEKTSVTGHLVGCTWLCNTMPNISLTRFHCESCKPHVKWTPSVNWDQGLHRWSENCLVGKYLLHAFLHYDNTVEQKEVTKLIVYHNSSILSRHIRENCDVSLGTSASYL